MRRCEIEHTTKKWSIFCIKVFHLLFVVQSVAQSCLTLCNPMHYSTRVPCPSLSLRVCSTSCPLSQWCHPTILCHPLLLLLSIFPRIGVFSNESTLHIRWAKYWSFSFSSSTSNEYSELISFRIDWFDLLAVQGTLKSSSAPQFESIHSSALNLLYGPTLISVRDY